MVAMLYTRVWIVAFDEVIQQYVGRLSSAADKIAWRKVGIIPNLKIKLCSGTTSFEQPISGTTSFF